MQSRKAPESMGSPVRARKRRGDRILHGVPGAARTDPGSSRAGPAVRMLFAFLAASFAIVTSSSHTLPVSAPRKKSSLTLFCLTDRPRNAKVNLFQTVPILTFFAIPAGPQGRPASMSTTRIDRGEDARQRKASS